MTQQFDAIIVGAGAAGLMCAWQAGLRGRSILLLDHASKLAEKIRISGGGRCNFTNLDVRPEHYLSQNPHFCRSALARFTSKDFMDLLDQHQVMYHEKTLGQLFCNDGSSAIIEMLAQGCQQAGVIRQMACVIESVVQESNVFRVVSNHGVFHAGQLVIATGGLSIPQIGASDFGFKIAEQFSHPVVTPRPALVPLVMPKSIWADYAELSGVSLPVVVSNGDISFKENMLFTHRGLSGPAILQISSYWQPEQKLSINLLPEHLFSDLAKNNKKRLDNLLCQYLPKALVVKLCQELTAHFECLPVNQYNPKQLKQIAEHIHAWTLTPAGTLGYNKAEVTCGGVDTRFVSSKTMASTKVNGLFFIGEVLDVTGQLGGYNFQWAWSSAFVAAMSL